MVRGGKQSPVIVLNPQPVMMKVFESAGFSFSLCCVRLILLAFGTPDCYTFATQSNLSNDYITGSLVFLLDAALHDINRASSHLLISRSAARGVTSFTSVRL